MDTNKNKFDTLENFIFNKINLKDNNDKLFIVQQNNLIINNYHIYLISMITF